MIIFRILTTNALSFYLSSEPLDTGGVDKKFGSLKVMIVIYSTTLHMTHDQVPAVGDGVLVAAGGVVRLQGVLQEPLGVGVRVTLVGGAQNDKGNLEI